MSLLAQRYAESLLSLAVDKDKVSLYKEQIKLVGESFDVAQVRNFFASSKVSKEEKKELCRSAFEGKVDKYVLNFLYVMADKNRLVYYQEIFREFIHLCNQELDIVEGTIETVRPLDKKLIEKLEKVLSSEDRKVELEERIDDSLISGFRIIMGNRIIDNTMRNRIDDLETSLKRKDGDLWT